MNSKEHLRQESIQQELENHVVVVNSQETINNIIQKRELRRHIVMFLIPDSDNEEEDKKFIDKIFSDTTFTNKVDIYNRCGKFKEKTKRTIKIKFKNHQNTTRVLIDNKIIRKNIASINKTEITWKNSEMWKIY